MIVEAALPLFLAHGEMVTTRQIADAAGIAEGTIFRAFADKDEVIEAVIDAALDTGPLDRALEALPASGTVDADLRAAVVILQQRVVDVWRLLSAIGARFHERARRPTEDLDALVALMESHRSDLRVDPVVAARLLRALVLSTTHPMIAAEPQAADEIVDLFLNGVRAPKRTRAGASC